MRGWGSLVVGCQAVFCCQYASRNGIPSFLSLSFPATATGRNSSLCWQRAGVELKRARTAMAQVQVESDHSRALEARILSQLVMDGNGYAFGSTEHQEVLDRMAALSQMMLSDPAAGNVAATFDAKFNAGFVLFMEFFEAYSGCFSYTTPSPEAISRAYIAVVKSSEAWTQVAAMAPNIGFQCHARSTCALQFVGSGHLHVLPEFDNEIFAGRRCCRLRDNIMAYDFDTHHAQSKKFGPTTDCFLHGTNEMGVLLWNGDVEAAKAGWRKQIEARKKIEALVLKGDSTWGAYLYEELTCRAILIGGMMAAGEMGMVRELIPHTFTGIALRDPNVEAELEKTIQDTPFSWDTAGYRFFRKETMVLQARALDALVGEGEVDVEALKTWLPRPDELIYIAEHESVHSHAHQSGAAHPAILCAMVYATRLGSWVQAEAIVRGILSIAPLGDGKGFGMQALVRIEAFRLLARCCGSSGKAVEACEELERAASESRTVGYVWMEAESLRDMLLWVEEPERKSVQSRIDAVVSTFVIGDGEAGKG